MLPALEADGLGLQGELTPGPQYGAGFSDTMTTAKMKKTTSTATTLKKPNRNESSSRPDPGDAPLAGSA